jgi:DNA-binding transcriptional LysR family regulator
MAIGGVDLNLLVTLRALLEEGNVTHAGCRVGMSQPAMSIALGRLRRHYKDELLVRSGRDYSLTPLAKALLPSVQESLRLIESALDLSDGFVPASSSRTFSILLSDYSIMVLIEPLLRRVHEQAPDVGLELSPIPPDMQESERGLLQHDLLIAPMGFRFLGRSEVIFRDRFVCIVDPGNSRLRDGWLSLEDLGKLPHAAATFGHSGLNPAERALDELGVARHVQVTTVGWLSLPFVVAGTDLVAVLPERLARRVAAAAGVTVAEPPFGRVELVEAAWWHPMRTADPALAWLRTVLAEAAASLPAVRPAGADTRNIEALFPLQAQAT